MVLVVALTARKPAQSGIRGSSNGLVASLGFSACSKASRKAVRGTHARVIQAQTRDVHEIYQITSPLRLDLHDCVARIRS